MQKKRHEDPQEESSKIAHTSESDQTSCSYLMKDLEKDKNLINSTKMFDFPTFNGLMGRLILVKITREKIQNI